MRIRGIAVFLLALQVSAASPAGLATHQDDAEIERWITELVHSDPARRTDAEKKLIKAGPKALPALKKAFESKTADLAARAKAVAAEIERLEFERQYDATERPRRLEIVTLQIKDATLGEAIKTLGSQVDSTLHTTVDAKQKLTIDVKEVPIRKCLDQIEDALKVTVQSKYGWHKVVAGASTRKKRAYVPGVTFEFSLTPFKPEGQAPGWSLQTEQSGTATVFVDSIEVLDSAKAAVQIERCGRCGPRFVLLKTDKPGPFTVRLKGRLVWESPYDLQVTDPAKAQDFKVGPFAIKYEWPKASWTASDPVPDRLIGRAELIGKLNKKLQGPGGGGAMGVGISPPEPRSANTWCACATGPSPLVAQPPIMLTSGSYVEAAFRTRKPEQFDSMKVRFYKAIEEKFETEASVSVN